MINAVAIFCEDIREEKSGQNTLVGIYADNILVPSVPAVMSKLALYMRINFAPSEDIKSASFELVLPDGEHILIGDVTSSLIDDANADAIRTGRPFSTLVANAVFPQFILKQHGTLSAVVSINGNRLVCGLLNVLAEVKDAK